MSSSVTFVCRAFCVVMGTLTVHPHSVCLLSPHPIFTHLIKIVSSNIHLGAGHITRVTEKVSQIPKFSVLQWYSFWPWVYLPDHDISIFPKCWYIVLMRRGGCFSSQKSTHNNLHLCWLLGAFLVKVDQSSGVASLMSSEQAWSVALPTSTWFSFKSGSKLSDKNGTWKKLAGLLCWFVLLWWYFTSGKVKTFDKAPLRKIIPCDWKMVFLGGAWRPTTCDDINENESLNHARVEG